MLDQSDQDLMDGLRTLGPLLVQHQPWEGERDDAPHYKRHKPQNQWTVKQEQPERAQPNLLPLLRTLTNLVIQHDRNLHTLQRQDCYVMFAQNSQQGMAPLMSRMATEWKAQLTSSPTSPPALTLRTHLVAGLLKELLQRVTTLSNSSPGQELWDTTVKKGYIQADGSWVYMRWVPEQRQMQPAPRAPCQMAKMMKNLQIMLDLLKEPTHVVRFQSLRGTSETITWILQLSMRDSEFWLLMDDLAQNAVWSLLGMSCKRYTQTQSKLATQLLEALGKGKGSPKGKGKGKASPAHSGQKN